VPPAQTDDATAVADALHSAAIHLLRRVRRVDDASGLSPAGLSALSVLVFGGSLRLTDLASAEHVTPATMTRLVNGLQMRRLVRRTKSNTDARETMIEATVKGIATMRSAKARRVRKLAEALRSLDPADFAKLKDAVGVLRVVSRRG
jgi:DNA-binding MarR family transcriptional regulator